MKAHSATIFLSDAEILHHQAHPDNQFQLRLHAPDCAQHAKPGHFVHLQCHPLQPLRRPLSLMRADPTQGWIDLLYKVVGQGTQLLSTRQPGESLSLLGPIGQPFQLHQKHARPLLLGGGVGLPPMVFLAEQLKQQQDHFQPLVLLASEIPFPFQFGQAQQPIPGIAPEVTTTMPLLDNWAIPNRLASQQGYPGCFNGLITALAQQWLINLSLAERQQTELFACGPEPMLQAVARLAQQFDLPCQLSLEAFMACGIGGCAGCTVPTYTSDGTQHMKRVCVDGPVFTANQVFPKERLTEK